MRIQGHEISCRRNRQIKLNYFPGHFATSHSHIDYYINLNTVRMNSAMAKLCAEEFANGKLYNTPIDTIVCLESTVMVGAFVAEALTQGGSRGINAGKSITVLSPEISTDNQLVFNDELQQHVQDKRILILLSSVTTGRSLNRAVECLKYYGGILVAVASLFSAIEAMGDMPVQRLFSEADFPEYHSYSSSECPMCKNGRKLDGFVMATGYRRL